MLRLAPSTAVVTMRMMQLRNGAGLELFEMHGPDQEMHGHNQRPAARPSDFGHQHAAVYADDIEYGCGQRCQNADLNSSKTAGLMPPLPDSEFFSPAVRS